MGIIIFLWIVTSTAGLVLSTYEFLKSVRSYQDVNNKTNGRRVVARDLLIRSVLFLLLFFDFTAIGVIAQYMVVADMGASAQITVRNMVTRPAILIAVVLLVGNLLSSVYTRMRLEKVEKSNEQLDRVEQIVTEIQDRGQSDRPLEQQDRAEGHKHRKDKS